MKTKCAGCGKEYKWTGSAFCGPCRRDKAKPIDTLCAGCGVPAHAMFCDVCGAKLVAAGKKLYAQERYNKLTNDDKKRVGNPQYSDGVIPAP